MSGRRLTVLAVVAAALVAGCDEDRRAISRDDLPDVPAEPTETVELGDDGFAPDELVITTEDLVEFRNVGDDDHGVRTDDFRIDTGLIFPGESTLVIFDEAGRYEVIDVADEDATMTVVAEPAPTD